MKLWLRILIIAVVVLEAVSLALYAFIALKGKSIIIHNLYDFTGRKVEIADFKIRPPLRLEITGLNIEGLAKANSISVKPSFFGFLTGKIVLNEVTIPELQLNYERAPDKAGEPAKLETLPMPIPTPRIGNLFVKNLNVKNGRIDFFDRTAGKDGIKIAVKEINFNLNSTYVFPHSLITNFSLQGKIPWQAGQEEGKIDIEGWLNITKKDMQATVKIDDIDGIYLYPYYLAWVNLEQAGIEKAKLSLISNISGLNDVVTAQCRIELTDIVRKTRPALETEKKAEKMTDVVLGMFKEADEGKIALDFTVKTKMTRPEFGVSDIKTAIEEKIMKARSGGGIKPADLILFPIKIVEGSIKGATDISTAIIGGTLSIGTEFGKALGDTFKREK